MASKCRSGFTQPEYNQSKNSLCNTALKLKTWATNFDLNDGDIWEEKSSLSQSLSVEGMDTPMWYQHFLIMFRHVAESNEGFSSLWKAYWRTYSRIWEKVRTSKVTQYRPLTIEPKKPGKRLKRPKC